MQIHDIKLNTKRKKRKTIGRGGKKGTYSGKGNKGQKARSGGNVNPLFEGGRSTLVDHMKKKRGFTSLKKKNIVIKISELEKKFADGGIINTENLVKAGFLSRSESFNRVVKILGNNEIKVKLTIGEEILVSASAKSSIEKAGGSVTIKKEVTDKE